MTCRGAAGSMHTHRHLTAPYLACGLSLTEASMAQQQLRRSRCNHWLLCSLACYLNGCAATLVQCLDAQYLQEAMNCTDLLDLVHLLRA